MKRIYLVSPCEYTAFGFSTLMEAIPGHSIRVILVNETRQLLHYLNAEPGIRQQPSVLVVDMTYHERSVMALALWFLWNLSVMYSDGRIPARIPCIILGRNDTLNKDIYPFASICPSLPVQQLQNLIIETLTTPDPYIRKMYAFRRLSNEERFVINAYLKGMSVNEIAEIMKIPYRKVNYYRHSAIKKIGLGKQNEYILLMGKLFL